MYFKINNTKKLTMNNKKIMNISKKFVINKILNKKIGDRWWNNVWKKIKEWLNKKFKIK